jgi:hypothetical protein
LPSDTDLDRKFQALVSPILGDRSIELADTIWRFDGVGDARALIPLCLAA